MEFSFSNIDVYKSGSQILKNVSGHISPGELMAIMGPSGAGKTTLLNTLAGREPGYSGEITLGEEAIDKSLKRKSCYVLQHDIFFGKLTLRQTLEPCLKFAAMVRLPDTMSTEEKMEKMEKVCQDLDLTDCLGTVMGDIFTQGLSGGQKKRASIACELLRDPDLIFLDEPTTGLDSGTASSLISLLQQYAAKSNKTVIASIHQPSSKNFFQFDKLLLLTQGEVAYFGDTQKVVEYFESVGLEVNVNMNPADFILEALEQSEEIRETLLTAAARIPSTQSPLTKSVSTEALNEKKPTMLGQLSAKFTKKSQAAGDLEDQSAYSDLDPGSVYMSLIDLDTVANDNGHGNPSWPTGFVTQYTQLTRRTFIESRQRILDKIKLAENLAICAVVSLIFFQLPRDEGTLRDRMGAVFFIAAHWGFIPLFDVVTSFPMEKVVIDKERSAGWYRLSAYYLAKMTAELVLILIQPAVFVVIAYWVIGLNGIEAFFATLGTVFLDSLTGQSIGLFVGIACEQINQAMTVSITLQMGVMLLGGLFTRSLPTWLDWAKYLSFLHYSFHSLMVLEFQNAQPVSCLPNNSSAFVICNDANVTDIPSEKVLEYFGVDLDYWQYIISLIVFTVVFRVLGYLTLRFVRKPT